MKKLLLIFALLIAAPVFADTGYVSPETYAINEADLIDYFDIPPAKKPNLDALDKPIKKTATAKAKKERKVKEPKKPYEERMIYKMAKWWTDKTYKYENPYHGEKHEIKVKAREEYERKQAEKAIEENL